MSAELDDGVSKQADRSRAITNRTAAELIKIPVATDANKETKLKDEDHNNDVRYDMITRKLYYRKDDHAMRFVVQY